MAPAVCLGNTNRPLTTAVWEPGAATRSWGTLVPFPFFCPGSDSVGISCWPLTWGHSTSCDITVWVLATWLEAYFKANTEQRQSLFGKGSHPDAGICKVESPLSKAASLPLLPFGI